MSTLTFLKLDVSGDSRHDFDLEDAASVKAAQAFFQQMRDVEGRVVYRLSDVDGGTSEVVHKLDHKAQPGTLVAAMRVVGG